MITQPPDGEDRNGDAERRHTQESPVTDTVSRRAEQHRIRDATPESIGPYKILERVGEGGMGTVYVAEQRAPVRRRVALKVIKLGMDTKQVLARFEVEHHALAIMNHPNIARVYDAGATAEGRPYFVMEHVPGIPINDYCDRNRLPTRQRLDLFMEVCHGVQHAHQKGVIHRDIKPSNILVMMQDGKPVPKIIDFGVAKATGQQLTERTVYTELGQLVGTPEYMSPEQAEMTAIDIDTRTDVYSLGAILYELLVGALPFDRKTLRKAGYAEIQRIIREVDPPKPSTRLSTLDPSDSNEAAQRRGTDARALARHLRGDLDWIILKALEKDRTRRYETANGLALDIARHLNHEPVSAGPPGATYRAKKFCRRNKGVISAAAAVFVVLVAGVIVSTSQYLKAETARAQQSRERERAEEARDDSDAVVKFLSDMLAAVKPEEQGRDVTVRQVLDEAAKTIGEKFRDKPLIEARLRHTIGNSYRGLGLYDSAEPHDVAAASIRRRELGPRHRDTLASMNNLALTLQSQGKFSGAAEAHRTTYEIQRRILGEEHAETLRSMIGLGNALRAQGKYVQAETLHRQTLEIRRRVLGDEHPSTLLAMNNLANVLLGQGKYAEAQKLYRKTLEIRRRVLGEEHPGTLRSMNNLALALDDQGQYAEAEKLYQKALEIRRRVLGEEHPDTLTLMNNLANALLGQGKYAEAQKLYRKTLEIMRRVLGEEHPETLATMNNLAQTLGDLGKLSEAETLFRQTVETMRRVLGNQHPWLAESLVRLAEVLLEKGEPTEAQGLVQEALTIRQAALPEDHPDIADARSVLGECLTALGRYDEAEPLALESYDRLKTVQGESGYEAINALKRIVKLYDAWDAADPGKGYAEKAAEWREKLPDGD